MSYNKKAASINEAAFLLPKPPQRVLSNMRVIISAVFDVLR